MHKKPKLNNFIEFRISKVLLHILSHLIYDTLLVLLAPFYWWGLLKLRKFKWIMYAKVNCEWVWSWTQLFKPWSPWKIPLTHLQTSSFQSSIIYFFATRKLSCHNSETAWGYVTLQPPLWAFVIVEHYCRTVLATRISWWCAGWINGSLTRLNNNLWWETRNKADFIT